MATDFDDLCNEFILVMDLDAYDPEKHDGLLNSMEILGKSFGLTPDEKQMKCTLNDTIRSYKEYLQDLKTSSSTVNTNKKICTYDFRHLKTIYRKCDKGNNDENDAEAEIISKESDAVVEKTVNVSTQIDDGLDDVKEREAAQLIERNKELEKEVEDLKGALGRAEVDLEETYKKYANENASKLYNEDVFKRYVEERNNFVKTIKGKTSEHLEKFNSLTEQITLNFEKVLQLKNEH